MQVYVLDKDSATIVPNSKNWSSEYSVNLTYIDGSKNIHAIFAKRRPDVFITVNGTKERFPELYTLPLYVRRRWLDVQKKSEVTVHNIRVCYRSATQDEVRPHVSVFVTAFKSMERILRPFHSLMDQTYKEWECVIMDDSGDDTTWNAFLVPLALRDCRFRIFRGMCNDGNIGSVKYNAASLCYGDILVEMDHDDELLPNALEELANAFDKNPTVGMVGSDCIELYERTLDNYKYGDYFGYGRHGYYKQWYKNKWVNVARNGVLDAYTASHIIGVLNHVRAWRKTCYEEIGRHNWRLNVADDYDLIIRTLISKWKIGRLPLFLYKQYRNEGGDNFTNHRLKFIQILTQFQYHQYEPQIHKKLLELGMPDPVHGKTSFSRPELAFMHWGYNPTADVVLDPAPDRISVVMPTHGNHAKLVCRALKSLLKQTFTNWVVYVMGDKSPDLEKVMEDKGYLHESRVRWWNFDENRGSGTYMRNAALKVLVTTKTVTYLDDDNWIYDNHLATLHKAKTEQKTPDGRVPTFVFSSFVFEEKGKVLEDKKVICHEPKKGRIDTSAFLHDTSLFEKYDRYWRPERITNKETGKVTEVAGYAVDWDLVKVWVEGREPWVATGQCTLVYNNVNQNVDAIIKWYDDQKPDYVPSKPLIPEAGALNIGSRKPLSFGNLATQGLNLGNLKKRIVHDSPPRPEGLDAEIPQHEAKKTTTVRAEKSGASKKSPVAALIQSKQALSRALFTDRKQEDAKTHRKKDCVDTFPLGKPVLVAKGTLPCTVLRASESKHTEKKTNTTKQGQERKQAEAPPSRLDHLFMSALMAEKPPPPPPPPPSHVAPEGPPHIIVVKSPAKNRKNKTEAERVMDAIGNPEDCIVSVHEVENKNDNAVFILPNPQEWDETGDVDERDVDDVENFLLNED